MSVRSPSVVAIAAAAALAACAPRVPPPDLSLDPGALLAQVEQAAARVQRVRGEARIRVDGQGTRGSVPAFVAAEKPDRLRIEMLGFFGNPVAVLVVADGRIAIFDARERVFYRGAATPENLAVLVPLPLPPAELVGLLCGTPPLAGEPVSAEPGAGFVTLELRAGRRTERLRVMTGAAVDRATVSGDARTPDHEVRFGAPRQLDGARFPRELSLSSGAPKVRIDLAWTDEEPNAAIDAGLFRLEPPRGARVVELGETPLAPPTLFPEGGEAP